jgi:hypothetical protein
MSEHQRASRIHDTINDNTGSCFSFQRERGGDRTEDNNNKKQKYETKLIQKVNTNKKQKKKKKEERRVDVKMKIVSIKRTRDQKGKKIYKYKTVYSSTNTRSSF